MSSGVLPLPRGLRSEDHVHVHTPEEERAAKKRRIEVVDTPPHTPPTQEEEVTTTPQQQPEEEEEHTPHREDKDTPPHYTEHEQPQRRLATPRHMPALSGCRSVDNFEKLNRVEEGTYGVVYKARDRTTGEIVALKKIKMDREKEGFPITSLREIRVLMTYKHPNVVDVKEIVVGTKLDSIFIVMEFLEHDLRGLMQEMREDTRFLTSEVKCLMIQLLSGVAHLHDNWIVHR